MANFELPHFGQIDITQLEEYYRTETEFNNQNLSLDINFENKSISEEVAQTIRTFLENIFVFNTQNSIVITKDFNDEGEAKDYINFYLDDFNEDELARIIGQDVKGDSRERQLLNKLRLIRIGLYPDGKYGADYFGVFDYTIDIDGEPCNQLLVVKTKHNGDLDHVTWES